MPWLQGGEARLVELVVFFSLVLVTSELLGLVGFFKAPFLAGAGIVLAASATLFSRPVSLSASSPKEDPTPGLQLPSVPVLLAFAAAAVVVIVWSGGISQSLDSGIYRQDSMWYHLTLAAGFFQDGQIGGLQTTDPLSLAAWFYPQNSEVFHAVGMVALEGDFASIFLNLVWAGLTLLAAWNVGSQFGRPATMVAGAAALLVTPMMLTQAGNAPNDVAGLAFLVSSLAFLLMACPETSRSERPASGWNLPILGVAGLAIGLAVGTKLTMLVPLLILLVGVVWIAGKGTRLKATALFVGATFLTGGFWYLRNLVIAGNPIPWIQAGLLPGPNQLDLYPRPPHSIADYATHPETWNAFATGFANALGDLWPLMIALAAAGILLGLFPRRDRLLKLIALSGLAMAVVHVFLPISASGTFGSPSGFATNLRYAAPAILAGLICVTWIATSLEGTWRKLFSGAVVLMLTGTALTHLPGTSEAWVLALVLVAIAAISSFIYRSPLETTQKLIFGGTVVVLTLVAGSAIRSNYLEHRYDPRRMPTQDTPGFRSSGEWQPIQEFAQTIRGRRIGIVGPTSVFAQFMFYGDDLSNEVSFVGQPGAHGSMRPANSCAQWRDLVNQRDLDLLIFTPPADSGSQFESREAFWTRTDPEAKEMLRSYPASVFLLTGELDPSLCRRVSNVEMIPVPWGGMSPVPIESFPEPPPFQFEFFMDEDQS